MQNCSNAMQYIEHSWVSSTLGKGTTKTTPLLVLTLRGQYYLLPVKNPGQAEAKVLLRGAFCESLCFWGAGVSVTPFIEWASRRERLGMQMATSLVLPSFVGRKGSLSS